MNRLPLILLMLSSLVACQGRVAGYWNENGTDYSNYDAAQDRFAIFAEKAVAAPQIEAFAELDVLFDLLREDEVAYYIYTDWIDAAFYNPLSPCRNAALYEKAVGRMESDGLFPEREMEPFRQHMRWVQYNRTGSQAVVPGVELDGRRTLVLVLDFSCRSCREALEELADKPEWSDVRRVAIGFGYRDISEFSLWECFFPQDAYDVFDPEMTPVYFVIDPEGKVESTYRLL